MSPPAVGLLGILFLFVLVVLGMPIGFAFLCMGTAGLLYLSGLGATLSAVAGIPFTEISSFIFVAIPLFLLMGQFARHSGISRDLFNAAYRWIGRFRGGLAMASIASCAGFAACTGSSFATAATIGSVALPEMKRFGYSSSLSTGSVAAGGTLGILIPPSIPLIIYGLITTAPVGKLFLAGILPGLFQVAFYIIAISVLTKIDLSAGPKAPSFPLKEMLLSLKGVWGILVLFILIIGSIYLGIATPTEAAAVGSAGSFVFVLGKRQLTIDRLLSSLFDTSLTSCMLATIFMGAMVFSTFLATAGLPQLVANWLTNLNLPGLAILAIILAAYIPLGCIMESFSMILLTLPVILPILNALNINLIWFGILTIKMIEIGQITPPIGLNVFVIKGVAKDVPMEAIFRGILIFLMADIMLVALLFFFPQISLKIPSLMQ